MSLQQNDAIYDRILEDEEFLDAEWDKFDTTTKVEILTKAGVNLFEEFTKDMPDNQDPLI